MSWQCALERENSRIILYVVVDWLSRFLFDDPAFSSHRGECVLQLLACKSDRMNFQGSFSHSRAIKTLQLSVPFAPGQHSRNLLGYFTHSWVQTIEGFSLASPDEAPLVEFVDPLWEEIFWPVEEARWQQGDACRNMDPKTEYLCPQRGRKSDLKVLLRLRLPRASLLPPCLPRRRTPLGEMTRL